MKVWRCRVVLGWVKMGFVVGVESDEFVVGLCLKLVVKFVGVVDCFVWCCCWCEGFLLREKL